MKNVLFATMTAAMLSTVMFATPAEARDLRPYHLVFWVDKEEIPLKPGAKATARDGGNAIFIDNLLFNNQVACARALALLRLNFDSEAQGVCLAQGLTTTPQP
jgi:hypothetical protein